MDDALYDTSLTLYAVTESTTPLGSLLNCDLNSLNTNALKLRDHLSSGRARYEDEEEQEKIGGLRDCTWSHLRQDDRSTHGILVTLLYDKITYRFIFYVKPTSSSSTTRAGSRRQKAPSAAPPSASSLPLLFIKASTSLTARFLAFLTIHFQAPTIMPLKLPASHLPVTLSSYIASLVSAHATVANDYALQAFLQDTIGATKLTISITSAEIAKHLRTIDVDVPHETLFQLIEQGRNDAAHENFLEALRHHVHQRTGLLLPLTAAQQHQSAVTASGNEPDSTAPEPPLKLTRISNSAFALGSEGRLKFSTKAVAAVDAVAGLPSGPQENIVRRANLQLLEGLLDAAAAVSKGTNDGDN
ncbi:uncharacterized protein AB675_10561 [Cyphellophora attinorum]|uniref:Uncharacterized protein n=1 Tax=Cyphellophora attinorum TaxID=1664694 RepID=A0A0N0NMU6_9EURO|nr:uncharacterized protein AB675_10561 [Phialophora attinorum]KPI40758.1 hypothetical protein AB675_10561 [Phialophora attinorum]